MSKVCASSVAGGLCLLLAVPAAASPDVPALEELGKRVFFDTISEPAVMSCATCHVPANGWTGGSSSVNAGQVAIPGAISTRAGNRKPPMAAYASFAPRFSIPECPPGAGGPPCFPRGGLFWDGRASGELIGDEVFGDNRELQEAYGSYLGPAADQALGPFGNDVEQNVPDGEDDGLPGAEFVCRHVAEAPYVELYVRAWGEAPNCELDGVAISFKRIAVAISSWEHSSEVNSFSSKRDYALLPTADEDDSPGAFPLATFSPMENLGHDLFYGVTSKLNPTGKNANCASCHSSVPGSLGEDPEELYTENSFHNIGIPPNKEAANYDPFAPDVGLMATTGNPADRNRFRTTPLRNVDKRESKHFVKAYGHNGYFKSLKQIVHFYNTATAKPQCDTWMPAAMAMKHRCWPAPEHTGNQPPPILVGDLGLTPREEKAIVAYLRTLSDTETVEAPPPYRPSGLCGSDDYSCVQ